MLNRPNQKCTWSVRVRIFQLLCLFINLDCRQAIELGIDWFCTKIMLQFCGQMLGLVMIKAFFKFSIFFLVHIASSHVYSDFWLSLSSVFNKIIETDRLLQFGKPRKIFFDLGCRDTKKGERHCSRVISPLLISHRHFKYFVFLHAVHIHRDASKVQHISNFDRTCTIRKLTMLQSNHSLKVLLRFIGQSALTGQFYIT